MVSSTSAGGKHRRPRSVIQPPAATTRSLRHPEVAPIRQRADQRGEVRAPRERAVDDLPDSGLPQAGHTINRPRELVLDALEVRWQQLHAVVARWAVGEDCPGAGFVDADEEPVALFADVQADVGLPQDGQSGVGRPAALDDPDDRLGHQVLVGQRGHRQEHAREGEGPAREDPGRADDVLAIDLPVRGPYPPAPRTGGLESRDFGLAQYLRASRPRGPRQCLGEVRRVQVAVAREVEGAEDALVVHQWPQRQSLARVDNPGVDPYGLRRVGEPPILLEVRRARREAEAAGAAQSEILLHLDSELVNLGSRVPRQPDQVQVTGVCADVPGRMPGRTGGQLATLAQRDLRPPFPGQVVEHVASDHPAADDKRSILAIHLVRPPTDPRLPIPCPKPLRRRCYRKCATHGPSASGRGSQPRPGASSRTNMQPSS